MNNISKIISYIKWKIYRFKTDKPSIKDMDFSKTRVPFRIFSHPIDTLDSIKNENRGSLALANIMLLLYFVLSACEYLYTAFLFNGNRSENFNVFLTFMQSLGVPVLFVCCNWAVGTLISGEGKFKEIWIVTAYSLLPRLLVGFPLIALSGMLSNDESAIYTLLNSLSLVFTALFLFLGIMIIQQFTVKRTISSFVLTVVMMAIVLFILLLFFSVIQQIFMFINSIIVETAGRVQ